MSGNSNQTWWGCTLDKNLANFKNTNDGYMDNIHTLRDQYAADICVLLVGDGSPFGQAYIKAGPSQAFAIVWSPKTVVRKTFAHEVGHLYGAAHQSWIGCDPEYPDPPYSYGLGYDKKGHWGTIMVIGGWVHDLYRIEYFSHPTLQPFGEPIGNSMHNNALVLNNRAQTLSDFRTDLLSLNLDGPDYLEPYEQGTFTATPSGGSGTYINYRWWWRNDAGPLPPDYAPPGGYWFELTYYEGQQSITIGKPDDFSLKCEVTDSYNSTAIDIHSISVGGSLPKSAPIAQSEDVVQSPDIYSLNNNYPNPFNPSTTIEFELPKDSHIKLSIYSITGQKVITLIDNYYLKGYHNVRWNGINYSGNFVANGIYIYELIAGSKRLLNKMILTK